MVQRVATAARRPRGGALKEYPIEIEAQTLRLPAEYWRKARIMGAMRGTSMVGFVQMALDLIFDAASDQERAATGDRSASRRKARTQSG
jgi:hypothetical protein